MEITKRALVLVFTNSLGKNVSVTFNDPIEDADEDVVAAVMDDIISCKALGEDAIVTNKVEAKYVVQEEEEIPLV